MNQKILYLQQMELFSVCPYQKFYYNEMLKREMRKLRQENTREFTIEELANYDGSNGKPAYVAIDGIVYDVSLEATWGGSTHFGLYAGKDLTNEFTSCHGNIEILQNLPKVGVLK